MSDRIVFSPKAMFLRRNKDSATYRELMASSIIQEAARDALAEMAWRGCPREQLQGANLFIDMFMNMSEPEQTGMDVPQRSLKAL